MASPTPVPGNGTAGSTADDVARAQAGDSAAFERLYRAHAPRMMALCLRLAGDRTAAEELLQDAFVRAWERLGSFRGDSEFTTWMHRLTVNTFLQARRGDSRRTARIEPSEDIESLPAFAPASDPGARLDLERAIAQLPKGARTAFVLHDVEGYRHEEIAAMSGVAPATIRAQLHRARRLLMEALNR